MDLGASGVMVAPPSTVRTDDQIAGYFDMVNETLGPVAWCCRTILWPQACRCRRR